MRYAELENGRKLPPETLEFLRHRCLMADGWKRSREYLTLDVTSIVAEMLIGVGWVVSRAFYLKLPSGAKVHRHTDVGDVRTFHIPIETNDAAVSCWADSEGEHEQHLELGRVYVVDRTLDHWAENRGETDRVHLIVEVAR